MTIARERPVLVTGGAGFIGCNLADRLATEGHQVRVYDALLRPGVAANLDWLKSRHGDRIETVIADVRDARLVAEAARDTAAIFHLAAQVAVTTSLVDPGADLEINVGGTLNVLEAARPRRVPVIFASTNKVYGDLAELGFVREPTGYRPIARQPAQYGVDERQPIACHTPYGCSKGAADQYILDYARTFGLPTAALRMSCIYGERQLGTEDQGWAAHFLIQAIERRPITIFGDGDQVRDLLWVGDAVQAYIAAWRSIDKIAGCAFNLGGGPSNAVSLRTVIELAESVIGRHVEIRFADWRVGDQRWFVADSRAIVHALSLPPTRDWKDGLKGLAAWLAEHRAVKLATESPPVPARAAAS